MTQNVQLYSRKIQFFKYIQKLTFSFFFVYYLIILKVLYSLRRYLEILFIG